MHHDRAPHARMQRALDIERPCRVELTAHGRVGRVRNVGGRSVAALNVTLCVIALNEKSTVPPSAISTCAGVNAKLGAEIDAKQGNDGAVTMRRRFGVGRVDSVRASELSQ